MEMSLSDLKELAETVGVGKSGSRIVILRRIMEFAGRDALEHVGEPKPKKATTLLCRKHV